MKAGPTVPLVGEGSFSLATFQLCQSDEAESLELCVPKFVRMTTPSNKYKFWY